MSKKVTAYLYNKCSTCRKAKSWLMENGYEIEEVDIISNPPTVAQLQEMLSITEESINAFFNRSGQQYRELGLKDKLPNLSDQEKLELLTSNGKLVKRPLVTDGKQVTLGFNDNLFAERWGK